MCNKYRASSRHVVVFLYIKTNLEHVLIRLDDSGLVFLYTETNFGYVLIKLDDCGLAFLYIETNFGYVLIRLDDCGLVFPLRECALNWRQSMKLKASIALLTVVEVVCADILQVRVGGGGSEVLFFVSISIVMKYRTRGTVRTVQDCACGYVPVHGRPVWTIGRRVPRRCHLIKNDDANPSLLFLYIKSLPIHNH